VNWGLEIAGDAKDYKEGSTPLGKMHSLRNRKEACRKDPYFITPLQRPRRREKTALCERLDRRSGEKERGKKGGNGERLRHSSVAPYRKRKEPTPDWL